MLGPRLLLRPARVLLADDHPAKADYRLRALLEQDFDVVCLLGDGHAAVNAAARLPFDVSVLDTSLRRLDGVDATRRIRRQRPHARIVLVCGHAESSLVERGLAAGASGYVLKDAAGAELVPAVHAALRGEPFVSRELRKQDQAGMSTRRQPLGC